ncbi:non-ribosomal peptide synthetase [Lentzea nigeriaca]|uniref:non-ribosomal peptide synthetase n=1 Tax=Lentzea nigeriaca TaxID=1128665 RepID=UPI0019570105|nr:non-ribosomal peptide synthetase [Lentzea nigeriaca]MBM7863772.1 amino acid adenylation domain-containing protein [Lentzea nigeriaca]
MTTTLTEAQRALLARMSAPPGEREGLFPVTAAQRGLWLHDQVHPGDNAYHMPALLRLHGELDVALLERRLQDLVDRHESLRTTFVAVDGQPLQRVVASRQHPLSVVDAASLDEALASARSLAMEPFSLRSGPLFRSVLWRLSPVDHLLLLVVHHIVADGVAVSVLFAELAGAPAASASHPVDLALREVAAGSDDGYWTASLEDWTPALLPLIAGSAGCRTSHHDAPDVAVLARETTEYTVWLAALAAAWGRLTGRTDVVIGMPFAGRGTPDTQHTVGFLVMTLPVRLRWDGATTFHELVEIAGAAIRSAVGHAAVVQRPRLFDVLLTITPDLPVDLLAGARASTVPVEARSAKFPLTVDVNSEGLTCVHDTAVLDTDIVAGVVTAMRAVIAAPSRPVEDVPLARFTPRWPGVLAPRDELTRRADRLARTIRSHCDDVTLASRPVAVFASAGPDLAMACLAVVRAGGHHLVLNPDDPADRIWTAVAEHDPCLVVTAGSASMVGFSGVPRISADSTADPGGELPVPHPSLPAAVLPPGVVVSQGDLARLAAGPPAGGFAPVGSAEAVIELWRTLLVDEETRRDQRPVRHDDGAVVIGDRPWWHDGDTAVLDSRLRPQPPGWPGELCVALDGIGFADLPRLTAERLVPGDHTRLLRTGLHAVVRTDGIELVSLERWLCAQPDITDAAVVHRDDATVAYLVGAADHEDLRARLGGHAPDAFVTLDVIPRTQDGEPDTGRLTPPPDREPPAGALEELVARCWADVLGVDQAAIARTDDFFALGGHSLLATRLAARLSRELDRDIGVAAVFGHPTVAGTARAIEQQQDRSPLQRTGSAESPLSFTQQRLWFTQQYDPDSPRFTVPLTVRLEGDLDLTALRQALAVVVERHEPLRSLVDDGILLVSENSAPELSVVDAVPEGALGILEAAARKPFDLTTEHPLRALVVRLADTEHILLLTVHHIACDGWSVGVLAGELSAAYGAIRENREPDLPELPIGYGDFARWQRELPHDDLLRHWEHRLADAPLVLDLPADKPRPAVFRGRGGTVPIGLEVSGTSAVRKVAAAHDVTPFMVLLAGLAIVLRRCAGQDDMVIGTPIAGRERPEVEHLIGCFIDVAPLRLDLTGDPSVGEVLRRVRDTCLDAYAHQGLPFERLVEHLKPERDLSRTPVFQVMLALESGPVPTPEFPGVAATPIRVDNGTAQHDLTFWLRDQPHEIGGHVEFNLDVFSECGVERLVERLGTVLERLADTADDTPVSEVDVMSDGERRWLRSLGQGVSVPIRPGTMAVAVDPLAVVADDAVELTASQVLQRANEIATSLANKGVRRGDVVGVLLPRSAHVVEALLGVWLAGAAYLPLDPAFPEQRLRAMVADSHARLVIHTTDDLTGEQHPLPEVTGDDRAYVMYTSGSTGRPKGVLVPHSAVLNLLGSMTEAWQLTPADTVVAVTTLSFDISVLELFGPLLTGSRLVVASADQATDPVLLADLITRTKATVVQATPSTWRMLLDSGAQLPAGLRAWCGGEALPADVAKALLEAGLVVGNQYGPTETTIWSTVDSVTDPDAIGLGRPIANTDVMILDDALRPVPVGVLGEVCLGGAGVAHGYHGRPGLTAERFVPSTWAAGQRMYRTGDLARFTQDGVLRFEGRRDAQVKIRGHRIEPGEVEARLAEHDGVTEAVVVARDERLVAYVVGPASAEELRAHLRESLPEYMVPSVFVELAHVPHTPNGKVDRAALPDPAATTATAHHVAPRTPQEQTLARIWADVLDVSEKDISVLDSFFDLGGHSMLATRMVTKLGHRIALREVFEHPTIAELAPRLADEAIQSPIEPSTRDELSSAQERLWFLHRLDGPNPVYNMPFALRLTGVLDVSALSAALIDLQERHDVLRTVFAERGGVPRPVVHEPADVLTVRGITEPDLNAQVVAAAAHAFDLTTAAPLRAWLFRLGEQDHVLLIVLHHIAGDESSMRPLLTDLTTAYKARASGNAPGWTPLRVQYADYAAWQRHQRDDSLPFWRDRLADLPARLSLPGERRGPAHPTHRGNTVHFGLETDLRQALLDLAARHNATPFMVWQAAVAVLLHRMGAGTDIPLGTPADTRGHGELDDLVGLFLNAVVLRTDVTGDPGFAGLLARVRDADLEAFEHADLPFDRLVEALNPARSPGSHPLFGVYVAYRDKPVASPALPGLIARPHPVPELSAKADLAFALDHTGQASIIYATDRFDRATVEGIAARLHEVLRQVAADPDLPISGIEVLTDNERTTLLTDWNDTVCTMPDACFADLFEERAKVRPDHSAVVFGDTALTYRRLDEAANRLAHKLTEHGAAPDRLVGIMLPRSLEMIVAMVAVLKSGAGYLPLDPAYPAHRVELMKADAKPVFVIGPDDLDTTGYPDHAPERTAQPTSLAYVIYTSGSTGTPKGVAVTHAGVPGLIATATERCGVTENSRVVQFASISFDVAFWELCMSLLVGGTLVVAPSEVRLPDRVLTDFLARNEITHLALPPSLLAVLPEGCELPANGTVLTGSETVPAEVVGRHGPGRTLFNAYGPTEATVNSTLWRATGGPVTTVPIGVPDPDTTVYVLDGLDLVPPGVIGELCIAGRGLARGYLNRPGATATAFVPNPFGPPGSRMYRTGDLVRWTTEGELEFFGRADHQVQVRGFRVEPGEVEEALRRHPSVRDAVVLADTPGTGQTRLVAYVVTDDVEPLRDHLRELLPPHMVPSLFVPMDRIPRATNGKLDRVNLPRPGVAAAGVQEPPVTDQERAVAAVVCEVLGIGDIGLHDDFFELGGHSLQIPRIAVGVRERTGTDVSVKDVFLAPTVAGVVAALGRGTRTAPIVAVDRTARRRVAP